MPDRVAFMTAIIISIASPNIEHITTKKVQITTEKSKFGFFFIQDNLIVEKTCSSKHVLMMNLNATANKELRTWLW